MFHIFFIEREYIEFLYCQYYPAIGGVISNTLRSGKKNGNTPNQGLSMKFLKTLHCNICTLNTITHTHTIVQQHRLCYVLSSVNIAVPNYSQMLRLPAGVSFKSHVRDVPPRLMSVFNFTTFDFGQVSTFDWIIHLEPALKLFVLLLKQCRVELLQL